MKKQIICFLVYIFAVTSLFAQTPKDTIYAAKALVAPVIDGKADDACWEKAVWHNIDQVWIPYAAKMKTGDFEGKYKVSWDKDYVYILVEVIDDKLSDDHPNPLQNWWDDDCVEIFFDEDRSKGDHKSNYNAFAYHVSVFYDVVDMGIDSQGHLHNSNLIVKMDTLENNKYVWEFGMKAFNKTFVITSPEKSRVELVSRKLMGFSIAYCDNDETTARENFIGSMYMTSATANDNYITANYFGSLLLVDSLAQSPVSIETANNTDITIFPNPANGFVKINTGNSTLQSIRLISITGNIVFTQTFTTATSNEYTLSIPDQLSGLFVLEIEDMRGVKLRSKLLVE